MAKYRQIYESEPNFLFVYPNTWIERLYLIFLFLLGKTGMVMKVKQIPENWKTEEAYDETA